MGRLWKVSHKDAPLASSVEGVDSLKDPFVPNDFANDASNAMSLDCSGDDSEFDKALFNFYVNNKVKYLKRKISSASRRNVRQKRSSDFPSCSTFTRYSGKFFSGVVDGMCPRYKGVIEHFGMSCLLNFVRTEVSYLDQLNFGLHSIPDVKPRILAWRGNTVKQFAELDRNNSRSFGKRPLKRLCAPLNLQGSVGKSSGSKSVDIGPPDGTFAMKVQRTVGPRFGSQTALEVIQLVESTNQDKPKIFLDGAESLVLNVLDCVLHSSIPKVCASENHSMIKFSFGNKSVSIQSAIANREFVKVADIQETEVQKESHHLSSPVTPVVPPPVLDGGLDNPVVLSSSSTPAKVRAEAVVSQDAIPVRTLICEAKSNSASVPPAQPTAAPKGNSPSICKDGPAKEKVAVNTYGIPSLTELNRALGIQSLAEVCNDTLVNGDRNSHMEDTNASRDLSPIVPIRLSQYFHNELGDVQCSQYVADRYMKSFESPRSEDCVVMVNTPNSDISTNHVNPQTVDLCSPDIIKTSHQVGLKVNEVVVDVHKVGSSIFTPRCQELYRSNDVAYNKLPNFAAPATSGRNPLKANKAVVDVRKVGSSSFTARCQELSRCNDVAYNKLHNFAASTTSGRNPLKANKAVVDVRKVGSSSFTARCQELSRSNDVAYNKLHNFAASTTSGC